MTEPAVWPRVSVVMPIRNEADFIHQSLGAILEQDYPAERLQILVIDGLSDDGTRRLVKELAAAHPGRVELLDNPRRIVSTALNRALARSNGEVIVRVDGHTLIAHDYVRQVVVALARSGADCVGGRMQAEGDGLSARTIALATSSRFGIGDAAFHYLKSEAWVDTVYLGAWPRRVFERIGGFDEDLVRDQDDELSYRLRAAGGRLLLVPEIRSRYFNRASIGKLWRQYFGYGFYKVRVLQKHPKQMRPRQFVPLLFVAGSCVAVLAAPWWSVARWGFLTVWTLYGIANLTASRLTARQDRLSLPLLPIAFATLHLAYGAGFLCGLARFAPRWGDRQGNVPRLGRENSGSS